MVLWGQVIYGDTDSIFVEYPEEWSAERASQHARDELTPRINGELPSRVQVSTNYYRLQSTSVSREF
jgi:DNA polymerase elongation subunit (family B)